MAQRPFQLSRASTLDLVELVELAREHQQLPLRRLELVQVAGGCIHAGTTPRRPAGRRRGGRAARTALRCRRPPHASCSGLSAGRLRSVRGAPLGDGSVAATARALDRTQRTLARVVAIGACFKELKYFE